MAAVGVAAFWHTNLNVLSHLEAQLIDDFVSVNNVVKETSIGGYKFFLEGFVHDVKGKLFVSCEVAILEFCCVKLHS